MNHDILKWQLEKKPQQKVGKQAGTETLAITTNWAVCGWKDNKINIKKSMLQILSQYGCISQQDSTSIARRPLAIQLHVSTYIKNQIWRITYAE